MKKLMKIAALAAVVALAATGCAKAEAGHASSSSSPAATSYPDYETRSAGVVAFLDALPETEWDQYCAFLDVRGTAGEAVETLTAQYGPQPVPGVPAPILLHEIWVRCPNAPHFG
jgi:ABC-type glycerol-3-phosphate transport system substrate-binding protein